MYSHEEELARVQSLRKSELQQYLQENQGHLDQLQTVGEMDMCTTEKLRVAALMVCFVKATKKMKVWLLIVRLRMLAMYTNFEN